MRSCHIKTNNNNLYFHVSISVEPGQFLQVLQAVWAHFLCEFISCVSSFPAWPLWVFVSSLGLTIGLGLPASQRVNNCASLFLDFQSKCFPRLASGPQRERSNSFLHFSIKGKWFIWLLSFLKILPLSTGLTLAWIAREEDPPSYEIGKPGFPCGLETQGLLSSPPTMTIRYQSGQGSFTKLARWECPGHVCYLMMWFMPLIWRMVTEDLRSRLCSPIYLYLEMLFLRAPWALVMDMSISPSRS